MIKLRSTLNEKHLEAGYSGVNIGNPLYCGKLTMRVSHGATNSGWLYPQVGMYSIDLEFLNGNGYTNQILDWHIYDDVPEYNQINALLEANDQKKIFDLCLTKIDSMDLVNAAYASGFKDGERDLRIKLRQIIGIGT